MIAILMALFGRWGLGERVQRILAVGTAVVAMAGLCGLLWTCWLHRHDRRVIDDHEAGIAQDMAEDIDRAEHAAAEGDKERQAEAAMADADNRKAIDDAGQDHPEDVRGAAGPAVNAVADRLRNRTGQTGDAAR